MDTAERRATIELLTMLALGLFALMFFFQDRAWLVAISSATAGAAGMRFYYRFVRKRRSIDGARPAEK